MPNFKEITAARLKAKRIREVAVEFQRDRAQREELLTRIAAEEFKALAQMDILRTYGLKAFTAKGKKELRRQSQVGRAA